MIDDRFRHRVLIVDDDAGMRLLVRELLDQAIGVEVVGEARDGIEAVAEVARLHPDVVIMDVEMPYLDGPRATERILQSHPSTRVIALTGHVDSRAVTRMIVAGAVGYAVKGAKSHELAAAVRQAASRMAHVDREAMPALFTGIVELARAERARRRESERLNQLLLQTYQDTVRALAMALRSHDDFTYEHDGRVALLASDVAEQLGMPVDAVRDVRYGAIFHDIGKLGMPEELVAADSDELSLEAWAAARRHTLQGEQIIKPLGFLEGVSEIVRHTHEHWDGTGFPDHLAGEEIPLASRIILACDIWLTLTSPRDPTRRLGEDEARVRVRELAGQRLDPSVVDALVAVIDEPSELQSDIADQAA